MWPILAVLILCRAVFAPQTALAHAQLPGWMEVVYSPQRIRLNVNITVEQLCISQQLRVNDQEVYTADALKKASVAHGDYLLKHIYLHADGQRLAGTAAPAALPEEARTGLDPLSVGTSFILYELDYPLPLARRGRLPEQVQLQQDLFMDMPGPAGLPLDAYFTVRINDGEQPFETALLKQNAPIAFDCAAYAFVTPKPGLDMSPALFDTQPAAALPALAGPATTVTPDQTRIHFGSMMRQYLTHGIQHILHGPDHLLFIGALALAAMSFWDLIKVVTAFTLAHTLTLTLSVTHIFSLSNNIVEPMIAASIVFVALENVFFPHRARGWGRLVAAFAFGLFHGLGFAGGLVDAMSGMPSSGLATAIVAFSLGVETGHQMIVLPIFAFMSLSRKHLDKPSAGHAAKETPKPLFSQTAFRYGSFIISVAGLFFLLGKLGIIHLDT
jgi:hydrogenase/urease accessory protein HupE